VACLLVLAAALAGAAHAATPHVPAALEPWRPWVLDAHPEHACPYAIEQDAARPCVWPTHLALDVGAAGGRFELDVEVMRETFVALPGDAAAWPLDVTVAGSPVTVTARDGVPQALLAPGRHRLAGRFAWLERPQALRLPALVARTTLRVDGRDLPVHVEDGRVVLGAAGTAATQQDTLRVRVFRQLRDGHPTRLATRLLLDVSGQRREVALGRALLPGFTLESIEASLPVRLDAPGILRVLLEPGTHELTLVAWRHAPLEPMAPIRDGADWPERELWSFVAEPGLRRTTVSGAASIDPSLTDLPGDLQGDSVYALDAGTTLSFTVGERGDAAPAPDRYHVARTLLLDFDGSAFTSHDVVQADVAAPRRLAAQAGHEPGLVRVDGAAQLITALDGGAPSVALAAGTHEVESVSRSSGRVVPANGWDVAADSLTIDLKLPPGWSLLAAPGADAAPGSWLARWSLWRIFLLTLATIVAFRVLGPPSALLAVAALGLGLHHDAPVYPWFVLGGLLAVLRVVPAGGPWSPRLRALYVLVLVAAALPVLDFAVTRMRTALYPQLDTPPTAVVDSFEAAAAGGRLGAGVTTQPAEMSALADEALPVRARKLQAEAPPPAAVAMPAPEVARDEIVATGSYRREIANTQTGPGLPAWDWQSYALAFSGSVAAGQTVHVVLVPPWLGRIANVAMAAGLLLLLAAFACTLRPARADGLPRWLPAPLAGLALAFAAALPGDARAAEAAFPDEPLLRELAARLLAPPPCLPACAAVERATVAVADDRIEVRLVAHAQADIALPLPGHGFDWQPLVRTGAGGDAGAALRRAPDGSLLLRLRPGRHDVVVSADLAGRDELTLSFPLPPGQITVEASGWRALGVDRGRLAARALRLERSVQVQRDSAAGTAYTPPPIPPLVTVVRHLRFSHERLVYTAVYRRAPARGAIAVRVPLLPGERVLSDDVQVADGAVLVTLGDRDSRAYESQLEPLDTFTLEAAAEAGIVEVWSLDADSQWHLELSGLDAVRANSLRAGDLGLAQAERFFAPWPGERLDVRVVAPPAVPGPTRTLERLVIRHEQGPRQALEQASLTLRASQGGDLPVGLGEGAELTSVHVDGTPWPLPALAGGTLTLPVRVGEQRIDVAWRRDAPRGLLDRTPSIDLPLPVTNLHLETSVAADRWTLLVGGPLLGPAALFWGLFAVTLGVAFTLSRLRSLPLTTLDWLLLAAGMSTSNLWGTLVVAPWFLLLAARGHAAIPGRLAFNAVQVLLVLLTLAFAAVLVVSVQAGLLGLPDMRIEGNGSSAWQLAWYQDRAPAHDLPVGWALTAPLWLYRLLMLAWSIWLATALVRWLRWGFTQFSAGGRWRGRIVTPAVATP
jgi:hypothetical protein